MTKPERTRLKRTVRDVERLARDGDDIRRQIERAAAMSGNTPAEVELRLDWLRQLELPEPLPNETPPSSLATDKASKLNSASSVALITGTLGVLVAIISGIFLIAGQSHFREMRYPT